MENEDLIKKLEETSLPEIEIPNHKKRLKQVLFDKYYQEKRNWAIFNIFKKAVPVGAIVILLIVLIANNLIPPKYSLTQAKEIALSNPQIKELIEQGATIKDVKILENKAYILIQPLTNEELVGVEMETEEIKTGLKTEREFIGILAEVDFKNKKVSRIEEITPQFSPLAEEEKERAKEIAENNPEIKKIIPKEAKIMEIIPISSSGLRLIKEGNTVKVIPEQKDERAVRIIYELNQDQWEGEIDLIEEKVGRVKFLGEIEE